MKKIYYILVFVLCAGLITACKKDKKVTGNGTTTVTGNGTTKPTTLDLIKDSVYLYANEDYLWNTLLPTYTTFAPRSFANADDFTALQTELDALSQYAINPATNKPYEYVSNAPGHAKYSFMDNGAEQAALNGVKGDFGFDYGYNGPNDIRVIYVYPGSPAALAGIQRGYQITSVNNSTNISYDGISNGVTYGTGTGTNNNFVFNAIFNSGSISMILLKRDGVTSLNANLTATNYNVNPVLKDTVYTTGNGHKVGYIVFNSFTSATNADPLLTAAFSNFATQGITDLVVDLRYNGGGYVSTAEYLDNLIVPPAKNGTLMYNTYFNANLINGSDPLLKNQVRKDPSGGPDYNYSQIDYSVANNAVNFAKIGSLNIGRVFFIMTGNTASASELTINNLRPEMDVQFVGQTSYGKPVGFFDIDINKYTMFTPEFSVKNSANQGDYYSGFTPGATSYPGINDRDDYTKEFGDPAEGLLAHILNYVNTGTYAVQAPVIQSINSHAKTFSLQEANAVMMDVHRQKFTGMIAKKLKLKVKR
jgi:carboxyl-terminal processing protease